MSLPGKIFLVKNQMGEKPCDRCGMIYNQKRRKRCPHCYGLSDSELKAMLENKELIHQSNKKIGYLFVIAALFLFFLILYPSMINL